MKPSVVVLGKLGPMPRRKPLFFFQVNGIGLGLARVSGVIGTNYEKNLMVIFDSKQKKNI
jgi:hypothetical protein